jgi:hypothetical protein
MFELNRCRSVTAIVRLPMRYASGPVSGNLQ